MKKVKIETDATLLDVYGVLASKFCHFPNLGMYFKVIQLFKAKKEAFRERNSQKVKNDPILLHLTLQKLDRDESRFLIKGFKNLVPNSDSKGLLAPPDCSASNRDFTCSLLVENLMEFQ